MKTLIGMVLFLAASPMQAADAELPVALFNLAADARMHSRLPEAEVLYNRAITLLEAEDGPDSAALVRPLAGLALVRLAEGQLDEAAKMAERAVRVSGLHADDVLLTAEAQNALATVLMARGNPAQAETIEAKVAHDLNRSSATASQEYVDALANLGTSRLRLGNYRQAELDLREAEMAALRPGWPGHLSAATIWNNLAKTRAAQGDWKEAEKLFQKAIATWRAELGPRHPDLAAGLTNLATLYESRKRYPEAENLFRQAIAIDEASLGPDSLKAANDWDNLGALFAVQRRYRDAEQDIAKGLAIAEGKVGGAHPDTTRIAVNLALVYFSEAKFTDASNLLARVLPAREQVLGRNSAELAGLLRVYASSLKATHDYAAAERAELQATRIVTHNAL